jgi:hypothetical protein
MPICMWEFSRTSSDSTNSIYLQLNYANQLFNGWFIVEDLYSKSESSDYKSDPKV